MIDPKEDKIRSMIIGWIKTNKTTMYPAGGLAPDQDLLRAGILDSLDYLTIIEAVGSELGVEVDIANFEDAQLSTIAGMAKQIAKQAP